MFDRASMSPIEIVFVILPFDEESPQQSFIPPASIVAAASLKLVPILCVCV